MLNYIVFDSKTIGMLKTIENPCAFIEITKYATNEIIMVMH